MSIYDERSFYFKIMNIIKHFTSLVFLLIMGYGSLGQKKVQSFEVSRVINASAGEVWKVVGEDFGAIANSHPKIISSSYLEGSLTSGEGAERVCHFNEKATKYTHEKQIEYDPENLTFKVQVFHAERLPLDTDYSLATYQVVPLDKKSCKLVFSMEYRTKPAFLGPMAKGNFKKTLTNYLLSVEHHVLTGEIVNKETFKDIKRQY